MRTLERAISFATRALAPFLAASGAACTEEQRPRLPPRPEPVALPARDGPSPILFTDATAESGIDFVHDGGFDGAGWFYVEGIGSGVVAFDADGDEDVDLCFLSGRRLSGPPQEPPPRSRFFRNDGRGRFTDATEESGLGDERYAQGGCVADYDNDGDLDLYVTNFDEGNALWRNDGTGRFEDVAAAAGALGRPDAMDGACAFADVDNDGFVDLYVGACLAHTKANNPDCWRFSSYDREKRYRIYCPPAKFPALPDLLLRNRGDGTFEDFTEAAGLAGLVGRTLGVAFADYDDDGDADAFVACDNTANFLLVNDGSGRFHDVARDIGVAVGEDRSGMGTASGDFDRDGRIDFVATYFEQEWNGLYRNLGGMEFEEIAKKAGTAEPSYLLLAWGTALADLDLDGLPDWVVTNGRLQPNHDLLHHDAYGYRMPLLVHLNRGGRRFESLGAQAGEVVARPRSGRGLAAADLDGDGDLDLALNNNGDPAEILRNDSPRAGRHWLLVRPVGTKSNRAAIGARVTVTAGGIRQVAEVASGQSFYSQSDIRLHFGLGDAPIVEKLEVRWPSGRRSEMKDVAGDRLVVVTEPDQ